MQVWERAISCDPELGKPSSLVPKIANTSRRDTKNSFRLAEPYVFHLAMYQFERTVGLITTRHLSYCLQQRLFVMHPQAPGNPRLAPITKGTKGKETAKKEKETAIKSGSTLRS